MVRDTTPPSNDGSGAMSSESDSAGVRRGTVVGVDLDGYLDRGTVTLHGHDLAYFVRLVFTPAGPAVADLTVINPAGRPVTAADLRAIPLHRLARAVAAKARTRTLGELNSNVTAKSLERSGVTWGDLDPDNYRGKEAQSAPRRRRLLTDEYLTEIATLARELRDTQPGLPIRIEIARRYHVSVPTVDKWLAAARKRGILTPGELPQYRQRQSGRK